MADLNKSIRSIEHEVAVDVLNSIVSNANEYADTVAIEKDEKTLVTAVRAGNKVNKADVEKLLPVEGGIGGWGKVEGNLDLLEVLFLESIFSENKVNADNVQIIADVIKSNDGIKKEVEGDLLKYYLAPLESVWVADQYQNDKSDELSDAAKKVFKIIYKDFLSTPEAISAIDFSLANFKTKDIKIDAFNLIIKRCIDLGVDAKVIKQLIDKGISLIATNEIFLLDLHSQVKYEFYEKANKAFLDLDKTAKDDAEYSKMDEDSINANKELLEAVEVIEAKAAEIGLNLKDDDEGAEIMRLFIKSGVEYINTDSGITLSKVETETEEPKVETETEKPKAEPETEKPKAEPETPKANEISEEFVKGVMNKVTQFKGQHDDLNLGSIQVKNILKSLSNSILTSEDAKNSVKALMSYKSGSLGAEKFKPVGEYQDAVKNALYTCANYLKSGKHVNNCFFRLKEDKLTKAVKQEAKDDACYYKVSESGDGQFVNLHIKFSDEGYPSYNAEKTANAGRECTEIQDNDPLELLAIAAELTIGN